MLTTGVIGCGQAAVGRHLPVIDALDGLELDWVCDLEEDRARSAAEEYGVDWYTSAGTALETAPDTVHVCSPPPTHADLAVEALTAGADVLVEKPMAMTVGECEEMRDAAADAGRRLSVVHNNLFLAPSRRVLDGVAAGEFGDVLGVTAHLGRERNPQESRAWVGGLHGGRAGEHLPHPIYLVTHFLGEIKDVSVALTHDDAGNVVGADIQVADTGGRFGTVQYMRRAPPMKRYSLYGTRKRVDVDLFNYVDVENTTREPSKVSIVTDNLSAAAQLLFGTARNVLQYARFAATGEGELIAPGHYTLIRRFRDSVAEGVEVPVTPAEGRKVVRVLEAVERASG